MIETKRTQMLKCNFRFGLYAFSLSRYVFYAVISLAYSTVCQTSNILSDNAIKRIKYVHQRHKADYPCSLSL